MLKKLFITCDEATLICDKSQYNEASVFEKIQLNLHFLKCKVCKLYTEQNNKMSTLFSMRAMDCKKEKACMSSTEKDFLKEQLKKVEH